MGQAAPRGQRQAYDQTLQVALPQLEGHRNQRRAFDRCAVSGGRNEGPCADAFQGGLVEQGKAAAALHAQVGNPALLIHMGQQLDHALLPASA